MVEGARLESVCRGNSTEGSNPSLSANLTGSKHGLSVGLGAVSRQIAFPVSTPSARKTWDIKQNHMCPAVGIEQPRRVRPIDPRNPAAHRAVGSLEPSSNVHDASSCLARPQSPSGSCSRSRGRSSAEKAAGMKLARCEDAALRKSTQSNRVVVDNRREGAWASDARRGRWAGGRRQDVGFRAARR